LYSLLFTRFHSHQLSAAEAATAGPTLLIAGVQMATVAQRYELLESVEFTSDRRRMSVIVRCPDGMCALVPNACCSHEN
jgi:magnesium-transporting ATPase (P-type)